ncbi:putative transporter-like protein [Hapsidospora chrysogenum ATCC 11550]|uniref:Putative transporter-like protein n=1 Tax=Hapsidospora chrysogenum (strain ATCC 11550 / CBS 779.69 / DSM 880 / IAM 14645 / JCM 23072 / IMI 49137) TaxID=857340 RepID=A0A086SUD5_HAPC1|nr:putative transporter-like protein [Hapsidospora chrysogenum ATCC 11550]
MGEPQPVPVESAPPSRTKVALTVLFHSSCAILSTILSKSALNGIEAPVTLLGLQTAVQVVLFTTFGLFTGWIQLSRPPSAWLALLPLTVARLVGILAKTYCLASVNASVYQIARGLLLPFTLLLSLLVLRPRPYYPPLSLAGCAMVMAGFVAGMAADYGQALTSGKGIILGVGSSLTTAIESVVVKRFLGKSKEGMWQMVWMSNVMALPFYLPLLPLSGELSNAKNMFDMSETSEGGRQFLASASLTGVSAFLLTIATFMQIEVTSPTTHMIVTAARGVAQSSLAIVLLGEMLTFDRAGSMFLILGGSALYGWARDRYAQSKKPSEGAYQPVPRDEEAATDLKETKGDTLR